MKTTTVIFVLLFGFSLNGIAQKNPPRTKVFAASKTTDAALDNVDLDKENLFLSGHDLEIAENKARKSFAELTNLGKGFWIEQQPFQVTAERVTDSLLPLKTKANKDHDAFFF